MLGVSIVIPCYNPTEYLLEAIASARAQKGSAVEVVLVNDGTDSPGGLKVLETAHALADVYLDQSNRGPAAARNTGFRAARNEWIIPLDADDLLEPEYAEACGAALDTHPNAAFAYTDYRVFGRENYVERLSDYNLYRLLDRNVLTYAALIRKRVWEESGGYDESMRLGYEDWDFWLKLGARGYVGQHVGRVLFGYRKHAPSRDDAARQHHAEIIGAIRAKHPELYEYEARAGVKARWAPAVVVVAGSAQIGPQRILDWQRIEADTETALPECEAFLVPASAAVSEPSVGRSADAAHRSACATTAPDSVELAALAIWGGHDVLELEDGSMALSRRGFEQKLTPGRSLPVKTVTLPPRMETIHRHLANAGLLSLDAWRRHPVRSAARLIPLRLKEQVNRITQRRVFDLSFYLQFQPLTVESSGVIAAPLVYMPEARSSRRRIGLVTPHLGPGGAERVLLEIAGALNSEACEVFLIATQSTDDFWLGQWRERAAHIYDLRKLVDMERVAAGIYSICVNWELDALVVQNSLAAYSVLPQIKQRLPGIITVDLIHSVDADWNIAAATRGVDAALDVRVATSAIARRGLIQQGIAQDKIRMILTGVDLERFRSEASVATGGIHRILFAGRLDAVKRPLLLAKIAHQLRRQRGRDDFRFVVTGDGPEAAGLRRRVSSNALEPLFEFLGRVPDIAPELAACEVVVLPSKAEGIPLIVLEAFAASRPVVASAVGGVPEVVTPETGILVPPGAAEIEDFVNALDLLIGDPELRRRLGANGRRMVEEKFDQRRAAEAYRALFE